MACLLHRVAKKPDEKCWEGVKEERKGLDIVNEDEPNLSGLDVELPVQSSAGCRCETARVHWEGLAQRQKPNVCCCLVIFAPLGMTRPWGFTISSLPKGALSCRELRSGQYVPVCCQTWIAANIAIGILAILINWQPFIKGVEASCCSQLHGTAPAPAQPQHCWKGDLVIYCLLRALRGEVQQDGIQTEMASESRNGSALLVSLVPPTRSRWWVPLSCHAAEPHLTTTTQVWAGTSLSTEVWTQPWEAFFKSFPASSVWKLFINGTTNFFKKAFPCVGDGGLWERTAISFPLSQI